MNIFQTTLSVILLCFGISLFGQENVHKVIAKADTLQKEYKFEEAINIYNDILKFSTDSVINIYIQNRITECENGLSLMEYVVRPTTISRKEVHVNDFYLYLSDLEDKSWISIPNPFIKAGKHKYYSALYFPEHSKRIIFSAPDESGSWNLYFSENISDQHWTAPAILSETLTSAGDEIFPFLSKDGRKLYFASTGFAGMGGFDLFISTWNDDIQDWNQPENLGFPYSSTSDDILFFNTSDGKYSIFVSNRDTRNDSLKIYVTKYIATSVKTPLKGNESAQIAARLDINSDHNISFSSNKSDSSSSMENYSSSVRSMRNLQKKYREKLQKLEESKNIYSKSSETDKSFLSETVNKLEKEANALKNELDAISNKVQKMEIDFLAQGIIPVISEKEENHVAEEISEESKDYLFIKHSMGTIPYMEVAIPKPKFDYSFKILDKGQFAEDNALPEGLIYQIQFAVFTRKASIKDLKGLSPVFVTMRSSNKYLHAVGLFRTYEEALSNLNKVRKRGFSQAFIIAYNNGKSIPVKNARILEKKLSTATTSYQVVLEGYPDGLPSSIIATIKETCNKEISKLFVNNKTQYLVGPFKNKADADYLIKILTDLGIENVSLKTIKL